MRYRLFWMVQMDNEKINSILLKSKILNTEDVDPRSCGQTMRKVFRLCWTHALAAVQKSTLKQVLLLILLMSRHIV